MDGMADKPQKYVDPSATGRKTITKEYAEAIYKVQESLTVEETEGTNNIFHVTISVPKDKNYAEELRDRLNAILPEFLEQNMPLPGGDYVGTECQSLTVVDEVDVLNNGQMLKDMIKFGVLIGAATFIVGCVVVVIIERYKEMNGNKKAAENTEA